MISMVSAKKCDNLRNLISRRLAANLLWAADSLPNHIGSCHRQINYYSLSSSISGMASTAYGPYAAQDPHQVSNLIKGLEACSKKGPGKKSGVHGKKSTFEVAGSDGVTVDSWKFQDWDYKRRDLPTYARGLFTYQKKDGTPEIAIRGYDKFFNQGEINETKLENVEKQTRGPYELSVKENGCIIFIGGLEGDRLLVCSKHSTGVRKDTDVSHAVAGENWVDMQLASIGKTRADLARELRKRNVTAVAELCDDSFEEHVLAYDQKSAGLYLHGMNLNLAEFATYPGELVHKFADEWNFKKADYLVKDDMETVQTFLHHCAETGSYSGRDTEGFVIRCQRREQGDKGNFQDWFYKFKFEEPYLMYRQWREATKAVISGRPPKYKKHQKITEEYLLFARRQLAKDAALGKAYMNNHGIIAMRDNFLRERGLKGSDIIRREIQDGESASSKDVARNIVLIPVASIGCGKTTVAVALTKLFGWGHVQNDNITGKSGRPKQFAIQVCNALTAYPAMIADRNNHQRREREQLINDVSKVVPDAKFVALQYVHEPKPDMLPAIREVTRERVLSRGDNHQTIQAGSKAPGEIIDIMEGFLKRFEAVNTNTQPDDAFDEVINLDIAASSRENLATIVNALATSFPKLIPDEPTTEDLDRAIDAALNDYQPDVKHDLSFKSNKSNKSHVKNNKTTLGGDHQRNGAAQINSVPATQAPVEYFCVRVPPNELVSILNKRFDAAPSDTAIFYRQLGHLRRIQSTFHVTLIHRASQKSHPDLWSQLSTLYSSALESQEEKNPAYPDPFLGKCSVELERIIWDSRIMCIMVRLLDDWETANAYAHITIGTASKSIKPKESSDLLQRYFEKSPNGETGIREMEITKGTQLEGSVRAVMQQQR